MIPASPANRNLTPHLPMQPPKLVSRESEWEDVSVSSIEEILPPSGELVVDPSAHSPIRFGDPAPESLDVTQRDQLAHNATVVAPLPGPGDWIADTYRIEAELGGGSMGVVFTALDKTLERKVAIKLIKANRHPADFRRRFMLEARAMALVNHPNVLTIHAFGEHENCPFIVMELVEGETLETWLEGQGLTPDLDAALRILNQVCLGVSAIHAAGTVHRDLKPSNILLDRQLRARVSDLGLAVRSLDGALVREVVGTPGYIAPEIQLGNIGGATVQSDLYSLACMSYELLTHRPPFTADDELVLAMQHATSAVQPPSSVRPELPKAFDDVLLKALAKDPRQRTTNVELFRRSLMEARHDSLEPVRILVAEDDLDYLEMLELLLRQEFPGADIECVADGKSAIQAFDREPASVVMLDLQMPEYDGVDVTAMLRARPNARLVPIIVVTASGGPKDWQLLSSLGADRFLVKPVNLDDLVSTIRRAVRERSSGVPPK
jgi:eukaryotic-like serine/threonine-protein kinase